MYENGLYLVLGLSTILSKKNPKTFLLQIFDGIFSSSSTFDTFEIHNIFYQDLIDLEDDIRVVVGTWKNISKKASFFAWYSLSQTSSKRLLQGEKL